MSRLPRHVERVARFRSREYPGVKRIARFGPREHPLVSLGDYPVGVDTLSRASDNRLKIFPEVVRSEVGIQILGGQVA